MKWSPIGPLAAFRESIQMILTEGVHDWYTGFEPTIPWAAFSPGQPRIFRCEDRKLWRPP